MPDFVKGNDVRGPFGKNQYLRSTRAVMFESYTCAKATVPSVTFDDGTNAGVGSTQKILQPGTVMAKVTSGADSGKIGPFQASVTDGRQTLANIVGLLDTFLPWQLLERDVEVSVAYHCAAVQGWCFEYNAGGTAIVLTNTTADAMRSVKGMDIIFH